MALRDWLPWRKPKVTGDRELANTFRRALLAVLEGDSDEAERLISAAVKADSDDVEPYRSLARLYRARGEVGRAIRVHQNLLLRRDLPTAQRDAVLFELAEDFREGGFSKRAIASYEEVLAHSPKNVEALRALCELQSDEGDFEAALATAHRLGRADRRDPVAEGSLQARFARAEHEGGRDDAARKAAKRALKRDPGNADARLLLGELEAERGRNKAALAAWRELARKGGPGADAVYPRLEASFSAIGKPNDFESLLREILEERPADAAARTALARLLQRRGEVDSGVLELRRVLDNHPRSVSARVELGRMLLDAGRDADALKEYRELLEWLAAREEGEE